MIEHIYRAIERWREIYDISSYKELIEKRIQVLEKELESMKINNPEIFFKGSK